MPFSVHSSLVRSLERRWPHASNGTRRMSSPPATATYTRGPAGAERLRNKPRVHETTRLLCDPGEERGSRLSVVRSSRGGSHIFRGRLFYFLIFSGVYSRFLLRAEEVVAE